MESKMGEDRREIFDKLLNGKDLKINYTITADEEKIARTYKEADINAKRAYLNFFFEKILVENKKVVNTQYQPVIDVLNKAKLGILTTNGLSWVDEIRNYYLASNSYKFIYASV